MAVPALRTVRMTVLVQRASSGVDDVPAIGPDDAVRPLGYGDRPLRVGAKGQARDPEDRGFLLHASGVGQNEPGVSLQRHEIEVAAWGLEYQAGRQVARQLCRRTGMDRKDQGHVQRYLGERREDAGKRLGIVYVARPMECDQAVLCRSKPEIRDRGARSDAVKVGEQGIDHGVADEVDLISPVSLDGKVANRIGGRRQQVVTAAVDDDPVDFFGHGPVATSQASLDVGEQAPGFGRHESSPKARVDITDDDAYVGSDVAEEFFHTGHHAGSLGCLASRTHLEPIVGLADAQFFEKDLAQLGVVMLPRVDQKDLPASRLDGIHDRLYLHEIGPSSGHAEVSHQ